MDKDRAKAFAGTMIGLMNGGALSMMCSIGHRTGLFDSMAGMEPSTSQQIADAAELDERYVREWLAAMTAGRIVDYDADADTYVLPVEHQTLLTRAGGPLNIASALQNMALLAQVEDDVVEAFHTGAGVPYSRFPKFGAIMAEESAARYDKALISEIIPSIPHAVEKLTAGATLADVGCGQGYALLLLAKEYPNSTFTGMDFSAEAVTHANERAKELGLDNAHFVERDVAQIGEIDTYDFITTFDAIHDQAYPHQVLEGIHAALKHDGHYLCVEPKAESNLADNMDDPVAPYVYTMSTMHCMSVSIAGGGEGLGTAWGTQLAMQYLADAGFTGITTHEVRSDRTNTHFVANKN